MVWVINDMRFDKGRYIKYQVSKGIILLIISLVFLIVGLIAGGHIFIQLGCIIIGFFGVFVSSFFIVELYVHGRNESLFFSTGKLRLIQIKSTSYPIYSWPDLTRRWEFEVNEIRAIRKRWFHIIVYGNIQRKIFDVDGLYEMRTIKKIRVSKYFSLQEQILNLDIEKYNQQQLKTAKRKDREISRFLREEGEE
jgi:hypothetical protein